MKSTQDIFYSACIKGYLNLIKVCIECGADIQDNWNQAIKTAIIYDHYELVKLLLNNKASPYDKHAWGDNAFWYAEYYKRVDIKELLDQYIKGNL